MFKKLLTSSLLTIAFVGSFFVNVKFEEESLQIREL
jgi:hypothetical protein